MNISGCSSLTRLCKILRILRSCQQIREVTLLSKFIRDSLSFPSDGGFFGSRNQALLWILRSVFVAVTIGIATSSSLFFFEHGVLAGLAAFVIVLLLGIFIVTMDALAK